MLTDDNGDESNHLKFHYKVRALEQDNHWEEQQKTKETWTRTGQVRNGADGVEAEWEHKTVTWYKWQWVEQRVRHAGSWEYTDKNTKPPAHDPNPEETTDREWLPIDPRQRQRQPVRPGYAMLYVDDATIVEGGSGKGVEKVSGTKSRRGPIGRLSFLIWDERCELLWAGIVTMS